MTVKAISANAVTASAVSASAVTAKSVNDSGGGGGDNVPSDYEAYWKFDGATISEWGADQSANGNDLSFNGNGASYVTAEQAGLRSGDSVLIQGDNVAADGNLQCLGLATTVTEWTVVMWRKFVDLGTLPTSGAVHVLFWWGQNGTPQITCRLQSTNDIACGTNDGSGATFATISGQLDTTNVWRIIASGDSTGSVRLRIKQGDTVDEVATTSVSETWPQSLNGFWLGGLQNSGAGGYETQASHYIDDTYVFLRQLTAEEEDAI